MVANYGVEVLTSDLIRKALFHSKANGIYFHNKGMKKKSYRYWKEWAENNGIQVFSQSDYKKRDL